MTQIKQDGCSHLPNGSEWHFEKRDNTEGGSIPAKMASGTTSALHGRLGKARATGKEDTDLFKG